MKILFLGDVVGRNARDAVIAALPELRRKYNLDAIIVNVENSAHGFGVTAQIAWVPKPSYTLTVRTPLYAVRN